MTKHALTALFVGFGLSVGLACGDAVQSMILPDAAAQGDAGSDADAPRTLAFEADCNVSLERSYNVEIGGELRTITRTSWFAEIEAEVPAGSVVHASSCSWSRPVDAFLPKACEVEFGCYGDEFLEVEHLGCSPVPAESVTYGGGKVLVSCGYNLSQGSTRSFDSVTVLVR